MNKKTALRPGEQIGRFDILKVMGQGAQGTVYLARDSHLQRQVAIKTLNVDEEGGQPAELKALMAEARIVSQFQHPNIVPLYDADEHDGYPYLIFEYVEGTTLSALLKKEGQLPVARAVEIAAQILDGVAYAHKKQIVHRDLKPGNVMIDAEGTPRIMDFGIAKSLNADKLAGSSGIIGTPLYMAPEYITVGVFDARADIFSVGMMLYEMLTGTTAARGANAREVLDRIVHQKFAAASAKNSDVSEQLDGIVLKALAKDPEDRFENAEAMNVALNKFLNPEDEMGGERFKPESSQSTIEFLLRRMRHKSDFPALSNTISEINKIVGSEQDGAAALSSVILKDFALTNKLLKLVNTAFYGQFGGTISTVSRAVVILGFESIRNAAITLLLFDHLQNKGQASNLKDETSAAFFNGVIGREIGSRTGLKDVEEAFICSMFHNLGKLLATFYFYEETLEIEKLMQQKGISEAHASYQVLGVSYEELGIGIARVWHFPEQITSSMRMVTEDKVKKPTTTLEKLRVISGLAGELSHLASSAPPEDRVKEVGELIRRYGESMPLSEKYLMSVIDKALQEMTVHANVLKINLPQSQFMRKVRQWSGKPAESTNVVSVDADTEAITMMENAVDNTLLKTSPLDGLGITETSVDGVETTTQIDASAVLAAGIQDITNTMVGDFTLNDLLRMILETMYRGMGFTRVLVCVRDVRTQSLHGRFGFGKDVDTVMKSFKIPLTYSPDVFHLALSKGVDIMINDIDADNIKERVPGWYRKAVPARSFLIFPIVVDKAPIAMIYADQDSGEMAIPPKELNLLKTLRNQAVLAVKQKR
jgi:serine/threonine protein kinase